jgi:hypothetical protein
MCKGDEPPLRGLQRPRRAFLRGPSACCGTVGEMRVADLAWLAIVTVLGCGPQVESDGGGGSEGDPGERPSSPGAMYSACATVDECAPLPLCVFPTREGGYCSASCVGPDDASGCAPAPGAGAEVSCLDIGLPDGATACALDCSQGVCPTGMTCEAIETPAGDPRRICF